MAISENRLRDSFQDLLNRAIAHGSRPSEQHALDCQLIAAIDVVACAHPDASADDIAYAYEVFEREYGQELTAS